MGCLLSAAQTQARREGLSWAGTQRRQWAHAHRSCPLFCEAVFDKRNIPSMCGPAVHASRCRGPLHVRLKAPLELCLYAMLMPSLEGRAAHPPSSALPCSQGVWHGGGCGAAGCPLSSAGPASTRLGEGGAVLSCRRALGLRLGVVPRPAAAATASPWRTLPAIVVN